GALVRRIFARLFGPSRATGVPIRSNREMRQLTRSGEMVNCLRESFLYSEKRARDILFRAIEGILTNASVRGVTLILSKLTREAAGRAQRDAQETDFTFSNWDTASKALLNAMLGARVLLTENGVEVSAGIGAQATPITGLKKDYQDLTEAYLLE